MEWISAGLPKPSRGATSRVMRKYGSWSMAQGMRQGTDVSPPKMCGKEEENDGAACNRTRRRLQPHAAEAAGAATARCGGCNRTRRRLRWLQTYTRRRLQPHTRLHGRESVLADVDRIVKAEDSLDLGE